MRPARTWPTAAAEADTPDTAMFAAPADAGEVATSSNDREAQAAQHRPTSPPARATVKHQTATPIASRGDTEPPSLPARPGVEVKDLLPRAGSRS